MVETSRLGAVEIENTQQSIILDQRNYDFRARDSIACNMPRECMHIRYDESFPAFGSGAADTSAKGNSHAGDLALEGAEHEFFASQEIKAYPIDVRQCLIESGGQVGGVGETIAFAEIQCGELFFQLAVGGGFAEACSGFEFGHGAQI